MARFGRVITAMVTPFSASGDLDIEAAKELSQWLVETGSEGLVVGGTTGESPTLSDSELMALSRAVRDSVSVPVIVGTGSNDTRHAVELTKRAHDTGADAVLSVTPYYNRPPQSGIAAHFAAIAKASPLPVIVYDVPVRTGRKIELSTLIHLANDVENIVGFKDAAGDIASTARLIDAAGPHFEVYSGDDNITLPLLAVGAVGLISVASHWAGRQFVAMFDAWESGDLAAARRENAKLFSSFEFEGSADIPNPLPVKAMLRVLGLAVGECRLPIGPAPEGLEDRARGVLATLK